MDMRYALSRVYPILHGNIQARGAVYSFHHLSNPADCEKEVTCFGGGQVRDARYDATGRDEDMAGQNWFEVNEGKGKWCLEEDLVGYISFAGLCRRWLGARGEGVLDTHLGCDYERAKINWGCSGL